MKQTRASIGQHLPRFKTRLYYQAKDEEIHSLPPISSENSLPQERPHQSLPLIPQTITLEITRQNTFQVLRLDRRNNGPCQNRNAHRISTKRVETTLRHFERSVLFEFPVAGPEEIDSQEWVFVAPFAEGLAAVGGDEAAAG